MTQLVRFKALIPLYNIIDILLKKIYYNARSKKKYYLVY